ncbi:MAG TPA: TonB-dependent receptor [Bacteroidales bacterium]|mgnify:FL=1|nr:TonB-dependent receptor [Bacteroidales bacterium]
MYLKYFKLLIFILGFQTTIFGQISGYVYEESNGNRSELTGVNVYWHDRSSGTTSDANGFYKIESTSSSNKLVFSYIGYVNDTIELSRDTQIPVNVVLSRTTLLDEVTIGERKQGTQISRMDPLIKQTITGEELHQAACCNLGESFETNASVDASYSDAATGAKQIKLLGLSGKYVQMLTENIPNFYGLSTSYGLGYIPGSWMKSIAVSKGTSTVSYGYEGITGQINTWYKEPEDLSDYFYLNLLSSTSGKNEMNADATINISPKLSSTIMVHAENNWLKPDHNNDGFYDMPAVRQYNIFNRYTINWNERFTSKFGIKYLDEYRRGGQTSYDHNINQNEQGHFGIGIATKRAEFFWKSGYNFKTKQHSSIAFISNLSYHNQDAFFGYTTYDANQISGYINMIYKTNIINDKHNLSTGVSFKYDDYDERIVKNDVATAQLKTEQIPGAFVEYMLKPIHQITIIAGYRADYHNIYGVFSTPRLHLKANITGTTTLRASLGKAYRTGSIIAENSFLLASSRELLISSDLKAEEAWNAGANITQYIPIGNREVTLQAEYYRTEFLNQIVVDIDQNVNQVHFYNLKGESFSNIWQIEMQYPFVKGMDFTAAFRYNDVRQTISDELREAPLTNRFKGLLSISYKTPLNKWQFDLTAQFNGHGRVPTTVSNPADYQRPETFDPYNIYNAQITKYFRKWDIYAGVENIFNFTQKNPIIAADMPWGENFDSSLIWGPIHGRKFYVGIRYRIERLPTQK